jgi:membrane-bound lytic murein transglycosylase B
MNSTSLCRLSYCRAVTPFLAIAAFSFVWMLGYTDCAFGEPLTVPHPFAALKIQLVRDGFDETLIQSLYSRPEVTFNQRGISAYFSHREATLDYGQFLTPRSIDEAIDYLGRNQKALKRAQSAYGVKGEIITAIILVETRLGTYIGKRLVLNTLSTLAALGDKDTRDGVWHAYLKNKADRSKQQFESWASKKSAWAYGELKSYLTYTKAQGIDPSSMRGSFAGALGIAQFLPSSVLKFGKDGNRDGRINLFDHEDAIESIASYLKEHGWRPSLTRNEAFRVILYYNNSKYYAETILKVSERLAKSSP